MVPTGTQEEMVKFCILKGQQKTEKTNTPPLLLLENAPHKPKTLYSNTWHLVA